MSLLYRDYTYIDGVPTGRGRLTSSETLAVTYRVIDDPYHKRYTVERYKNGRFDTVVYDSALLDFRHLKPSHQQGWQREILAESPQEMLCLLRNQEDRVVYIEKQRFRDLMCLECAVLSPQGLLLSIHRMHYQRFGDAFDGTLLYDAYDHLVMSKRYAVGEDGQFADLLEEVWNSDEKIL